MNENSPIWARLAETINAVLNGCPNASTMRTTTYGVMLGSLIIGVLISVSSVPPSAANPWIPSDMKTVGALVVMILLLMVRPQGLLGRKERIG